MEKERKGGQGKEERQKYSPTSQDGGLGNSRVLNKRRKGGRREEGTIVLKNSTKEKTAKT